MVRARVEKLCASLPWCEACSNFHLASAPVSPLLFPPIEIKCIGQACVWFYLVPSVAAFEALGSGKAKLTARQN